MMVKERREGCLDFMTQMRTDNQFVAEAEMTYKKIRDLQKVLTGFLYFHYRTLVWGRAEQSHIIAVRHFSIQM